MAVFFNEIIFIDPNQFFDPVDWVRAEIEAAFDQGKHVIPVLVAGANMCTASELPESIAHLSKMQAFKMTDRRWDDDIQDLLQLFRKAVPELRAESSRDQLGAEASPAQVLRELGERVLEEVIHRRNGSSRSKNSSNHRQPRLLVGFSRYVKKILMPFVLGAAIYIGLRLFGDDEMLQKLDQLEALLLVGWDRLMTYVKGLR